jgi:hypothetical protein
MALEQEQRAALRILEGIEEGTMSAAESFALVEDADPALVYLIFTWLRKRYRRSSVARRARRSCGSATPRSTICRS